MNTNDRVSNMETCYTASEVNVLKKSQKSLNDKCQVVKKFSLSPGRYF